jgi:hypothetical protein
LKTLNGWLHYDFFIHQNFKTNCKSLLCTFQINASSTEEGLNFYDSGHRFEHSQLLLVLLRSLPYASRALQSQALQVFPFCATCYVSVQAFFLLFRSLLNQICFWYINEKE